VAICQRSDVFPEGDTRGEIQDIPKNWIALGTWWIWQGGSLPFPDESEDKKTKKQGIEDRYLNHDDTGERRNAVQGLIPVGSGGEGIPGMEPTIIIFSDIEYAGDITSHGGITARLRKTHQGGDQGGGRLSLLSLAYITALAYTNVAVIALATRLELKCARTY